MPTWAFSTSGPIKLPQYKGSPQPAPAIPASCQLLPTMRTCASQHTLTIPLPQMVASQLVLLTGHQGPLSCLAPSPQPTVPVGQGIAGERGTFRSHQSFGGVFKIYFYSSYFFGLSGGHIHQVHTKERLKGNDWLIHQKVEKFPLLWPEHIFDHKTGKMWGSSHPFLMPPGESQQLWMDKRTNEGRKECHITGA